MTEEILQRVFHAQVTRTPIEPITDKRPDFSVSEGYEIQQALQQKAQENGETLCGYKMGLTSRAKQRDVGVEEPISGFLLERMRLDEQQPISVDSYIHPRIEPEIVVTLRSSLEGECSLEEIASATDFLGLGVELIDSRYKDFRFKIPDVVADNTSAAGFMVGKENALAQWKEIGLCGVVVSKNQQVVQTGAPAAVLEHPFYAVAELLKTLKKRGEGLKAGQTVLTGGISASIPIQRGDVFEVRWPFETLRLEIA